MLYINLSNCRLLRVGLSLRQLLDQDGSSKKMPPSGSPKTGVGLQMVIEGHILCLTKAVALVNQWANFWLVSHFVDTAVREDVLCSKARQELLPFGIETGVHNQLVAVQANGNPQHSTYISV